MTEDYDYVVSLVIIVVVEVAEVPLRNKDAFVMSLVGRAKRLQ